MNDLLEGEVIHYYENGTVRMIEEFEHGKQIAPPRKYRQ